MLPEWCHCHDLWLDTKTFLGKFYGVLLVPLNSFLPISIVEGFQILITFLLL